MKTVRHSSALRVSAALLCGALAPALLSAWLHPQGPAWMRGDEVGMSSARLWSDVLWVDAREGDVYKLGHVPGALNLSDQAWNSQIGDVLAAWKPGRRILVYCDGHGCESSRKVAQRMRSELGLTGIYVLTGGWAAWKEVNP